MKYKAIIIGSGLSGLSCAKELVKSIPNILVLDKGYKPGGRTASKTVSTELGDAVFDYGAQYFTVDELEFQFQVNHWVKNDFAKKWASTFESTVIDEHREAKVRYMGYPTMRSICEEMASSLPVKQQMKVVRLEQKEDKSWIVRCENGESFETESIINTAPLAQSLDLCYKSGIIPADKTVTFFNQQKYYNCAAVLLVSDSESAIPEPGGLWFDDLNPIRWAADNKKKGISKVTAVTLHLSPDFSKKAYQLSDDEVFETLRDDIIRYVPGKIVHRSIHRWRYSQPVNIVDLAYLRDDFYTNLWFCGDVFLNGRVENAWMSGYKTAKAFIEVQS